MVGYDAWSATYFVEDMEDYFGKGVMEAVHQGKKTESQPLKCLQADLRSNLIIYNSNPVDRWCLCNAAVDVDKNDNISLMKTSKATRRIDGTAALMDAYVVMQDHINDYMNII